MNLRFLIPLALLLASEAAFAAGVARFKEVIPGVYQWSDTCNVYVIRDGEAAVLIELGNGEVLDHLREVGVKKVEWVLFTHHHREQCQGAVRLRGTGIQVAGPAAERELFEQPTLFRKMEVTLGDRYTVYGSSYVRPPIQPIHLDRPLMTNDSFIWHGRAFRCFATPGNSPGSMTYVFKDAGRVLAFTGDVILSGAKMHTWFDTEWDYGFAAGIKVLRDSVSRIAQLAPEWLLPSHGEVISRPADQLSLYSRKLAELEKLYVRGYDPEAGSVAYQDKVSQPTTISNLFRVSPHLFKFKRPNFWPNFTLILSDTGHALLSDCGLLDEQFLDGALEEMQRQFGLSKIDAVLVSHMHGDHFLEAEHLRHRWGARIWALDNMVNKMEHPEWFDYAAPIQAYGKKAPDGTPLTGVHVDRSFKSGEQFTWEEYHFTVDWMPGQTEFACCLHGKIDGRNVAFTGDNIFGDPDNPEQSGHEAMVAHNSAILEEGYIYGAEYLTRLHPDLLMGGHSFVMDHPKAFIERYRHWAYAMRECFRGLSSEEDYRLWFDPFWVRAEPYRAWLRAGGTARLQLHVRNFASHTAPYRIEIHTPSGLTAGRPVLTGRLSRNSSRAVPIEVTAATHSSPGIHLVAFDVTLDGRRYGERFDAIVNVEP